MYSASVNASISFFYPIYSINLFNTSYLQRLICLLISSLPCFLNLKSPFFLHIFQLKYVHMYAGYVYFRADSLAPAPFFYYTQADYTIISRLSFQVSISLRIFMSKIGQKMHL